MAESLKSARLLLRAAQESDLDAFHAMFTNEDVMRYWYAKPFRYILAPTFYHVFHEYSIPVDPNELLCDAGQQRLTPALINQGTAYQPV